MTNYLSDIGPDLQEYFLEVERLASARQDRTRTVPFQRSRIASKENELWGKAAPWLADVHTLSVQLEKDLERVASRRAAGPRSAAHSGSIEARG